MPVVGQHPTTPDNTDAERDNRMIGAIVYWKATATLHIRPDPPLAPLFRGWWGALSSSEREGPPIPKIASHLHGGDCYIPTEGLRTITPQSFALLGNFGSPARGERLKNSRL